MLKIKMPGVRRDLLLFIRALCAVHVSRTMPKLMRRYWLPPDRPSEVLGRRWLPAFGDRYRQLRRKVFLLDYGLLKLRLDSRKVLAEADGHRCGGFLTLQQLPAGTCFVRTCHEARASVYVR